ncbi:MAG: hypothetical protein ACKVOE_09455 [Rickettsiales bacterium]
MFGLGKADDAANMMSFIGAPVTNPYGSGVAGWLQGGLAAIPGIGGALTSTTPINVLGLSMTSGALVSIAASGVIGIGGALLARWLEKREDPNAPIYWSKIIRYTALATSLLIALPSVLGAISVAFTFFASLTGQGAGSSMALSMRDTLGATTAHAGAAGGLATLVSHFIACGAAILPVGLATYFAKSGDAHAHTTATTDGTPQGQFTAREAARSQNSAQIALA